MAKKIPDYLIPGAEAYAVGQSNEESVPSLDVRAGAKPLLEVLPSTLRGMREDRDLSQREVMRNCDVGPGVYYHAELEGQRHSSTMETIAEMAKGMGTSVEEVMMRVAAESIDLDPAITSAALEELRRRAEPSGDPAAFQRAFGEIFQVHKADTDLTLDDIGERSGFSATTVGAVSRGGRPDQGVNTYFEIAGVFEQEGVSAPEFLGLSAAHAAGIYYSDPSEEPEFPAVNALLEEIKNRTSPRGRQ